MSKSISGKWRGHYAYFKFPDHGSGFDAIFNEEAGSIYGTIVDDFFPGEATFTGGFSYPSVNFIKKYTNVVEPYLYPIQYAGRMSEDGKSLSGTWVINSDNGATRGTWTAHRLDEDEKKAEKTEHSIQKEIDEVTI